MFKRRNDGTFRAKKKFDEGTVRQRLHVQAKNTLKRGIDLRVSVKLPPGEDINEWYAVHVVDFYNRISLLYDTISSHCTDAACPIMSGGPRYQYHWQDNKDYKKPTLLSAPKYINLLMDWIEEIINDEKIFPQDAGSPFPKNFISVCKKIFSRLYRVFVHVYIHHFDAIKELQAEAHVNQCYKHYYFFCIEFSLIDPKELKPLEALNQAFDST